MQVCPLSIRGCRKCSSSSSLTRRIMRLGISGSSKGMTRCSLQVILSTVVILALGNLWVSIHLVRERLSWWNDPLIDYSLSRDQLTLAEPDSTLIPESLSLRHAQLRASTSVLPPESSLLLVLCQDAQTLAQTHSLFYAFPWVLPYLLPPSDIGTLYFYPFLGTILESHPFSNFTWVGSVPFDVIKSFLSSTTNTLSLIHFLEETRNKNVNLLYFSNTIDSISNRLTNADLLYSGLTLEDALLLGGEHPETIQHFRSNLHNVTRIHSGSFVTRPSIMQAFLSWMNRILVAMASIHNFKFHSIHRQSNQLGDVLLSYYFYTRSTAILSIRPNHTDLETFITPPLVDLKPTMYVFDPQSLFSVSGQSNIFFVSPDLIPNKLL
jgi:hypothetical protein